MIRPERLAGSPSPVAFWVATGLVLAGTVVAGAALGAWLWLERDPGPAASADAAAIPTPGVKTGPFPGEAAPDFELPVLDGGTLKLSDHRGHRVVLNFFATWCEPCREEMPGFQAQAAAHAEHDWVFIGVNVMETAEPVAAFRDEFGLTFPVVLDETGWTSRQYVVQGTPTNIVIDREGNVVDRRLGYMSEADLAAMIAAVP